MKVVVVGAGIAGLTAGIYAARSGFDVTILEQHITFGGLSTAWKRKGYYFEGGMHWLTGSSPKVPLYNIWKEVGALKDNNPVTNRDPLYSVVDGNTQLDLFRNAEKMRDTLLAYAPEDKKAINRLYSDVKAFINFHMPVDDIPGLKTKKRIKTPLIDYIKMLPAVLKLPRLIKMSFTEYVNKFSSKNIRHLLFSVIGYRYNALSLIYTLGSFAQDDCGYPDGGSVRMAQNMLDTYTALGGKIEYKTKVVNIPVKDGKATGVNTDKGFISSDAVIVTQDARQAIDTLFDGELPDKWTHEMRKETVGEMNMFISLGIKADLKRLPKHMILPLDTPAEFCGLKFSEIRMNNYAGEKDYAPEGCSTLTCLLIGDSYDYWKKAKEDGSYKEKKEALGKSFIELVSKYIPEVKDNLEVIDVATPLTYERYCGSYQGSWMSVLSVGMVQKNYPQKLDSICNVYFAGQRLRSPGGLPLAVYTGRLAAEYLCRDNKVEFI